MTSRALIEAHRAAGRRFEAANCASFVREEGAGEPVVLLHGVPTSSFLWRKVLPELGERGLRGIALDLPGLGLADRPTEFDYSWGGLAAWAEAAIEALDIDRFHLLVHDVGGPIGFELAIRNPRRISSLTALDTLIGGEDFRRPWQMHPFSVPVLGELWLRSLNRYVFGLLFRKVGIARRDAVSQEEIYAHYDLIKATDGGRAFLRIMRGFELSAEKEQFYSEGLRSRPYPAQIIWGEHDKALGPTRRAKVERALRVQAQPLPGKHYLPEDFPTEIADAVAAIAR